LVPIGIRSVVIIKGRITMKLTGLARENCSGVSLGCCVISAGQPSFVVHDARLGSGLGPDDPMVLELEAICASFGRVIPYRPILELLRRYLHLAETMAADEIRRRVADVRDPEGEDVPIEEAERTRLRRRLWGSGRHAGR
jgi:hypothetical protein